jgi:hypothetical protein
MHNYNGKTGNTLEPDRDIILYGRTELSLAARLLKLSQFPEIAKKFFDRILFRTQSEEVEYCRHFSQRGFGVDVHHRHAGVRLLVAVVFRRRQRRFNVRDPDDSVFLKETQYGDG